MSRINIEDSLYNDNRFRNLEIEFLKLSKDKDAALGRIVRLFHLAQRFWSSNKELIPVNRFKNETENWDIIVSCGIAEIRENGVYIRGSSDQFQWLLERKEAGKSGGIASGKSRNNKIKNIAEINNDYEHELNKTVEANASKTKQTQAKRSKTNPLTLTLTPTLTLKEEYREDNTLLSSDSFVGKADDCIFIYNLFNDLVLETKMPKLKILNKNRRKVLSRAIKEIGSDKEKWKHIFLVASRKGFQKQDGTVWNPDFDYVFRNSNYIKFLEQENINIIKKTKIDQKRDVFKQMFNSNPYLKQPLEEL